MCVFNKNAFFGGGGGLSKNEADPLRKRTNFRLLQHQRDDAMKLTCIWPRLHTCTQEDLGESSQVPYKPK